LETIDYSTWSAGLKQRSAGHRVPLGATLELTRRCNNRCRHCYNNLPANDPAALASEMGTAEVCRLLEEFAAAGCVWLLLTGGEVLLRPDFHGIYDCAKANGLLATLFTNATLVTADLADRLARSRPFSIEVTLYGATRATYEAVTGVPGSFGRCLRGIAHLKERGLPLKLKSTVLTVNRHEIWEMKRFAEEDLGMPFRFDALLNPRCDSSPSPLLVRLIPEEVVALDLADPGREAALRDLAACGGFPATAANGRNELYVCGGGAHSFAIDPYGRMRLCALSPGEGYDLRRGSFRDGWERFLARLREQRIEPGSKCARCTLNALCGMCPANGELECGDPRQPVDFLCRVAHLRACVLGIPVPAHGDCEFCPGGAQHADMLMAAARLADASGRDTPVSRAVSGGRMGGKTPGAEQPCLRSL
jgi:radical SAM protein with 4Fe4S-binding SPASM domain